MHIGSSLFSLSFRHSRHLQVISLATRHDGKAPIKPNCTCMRLAAFKVSKCTWGMPVAGRPGWKHVTPPALGKSPGRHFSRATSGSGFKMPPSTTSTRADYTMMFWTLKGRSWPIAPTILPILPTSSPGGCKGLKYEENCRPQRGILA